jgi:hypothetical protein
MKKLLNLIIASFLVVPVFGQPTIQKDRIKFHGRQQEIQTFPNILNKIEKKEILLMGKQKNRGVFQAKSTSNSKMKMDSTIYQVMDNTSGQWVNYAKEMYSYNSNGTNFANFNFEWDENYNKWIGSYKQEYLYNSNLDLSVLTFYDFDKDKETWVESSKAEYSYDANGKDTLVSQYTWNEMNNRWDLFMKSENIYDPDGNLSQAISSVWDDSESKWNENSKGEYTYNEQENITLIKGWFWNNDSSKWVASMKMEINYDEFGNDTSSVWYTIDTTSVLKPVAKEKSVYDSNGNMITDISYTWNETDSLWIPESKEELSYDNTYTSDDLILPFYYSDLLNHMLTEASDYNYDGSDWVLSVKSRVYYSDPEITSIPEVNSENSISVYPNPASGRITFKMNGIADNLKIEIYDCQGRIKTDGTKWDSFFNSKFVDRNVCL